MIIKVVDSIMGSGKSTWARNYINSHPEMRWLFVTPYIDEIEKTREVCNLVVIDEPTKGRKSAKNKSEDLITLIYEGKNIATSHSLFLRIRHDSNLLTMIKQNQYNLIIDETLDVVRHIKISSDDIRALMASGIFEIDKKTKAIKWLNDNYQGYYNELKEHAKTGTVFSYQDEEALIWLFDPEVFLSFDTIYLLTYLFRGSRMREYCKYYRLQYDNYHIENGELIKGLGEYAEEKKHFAELIDVYHGPLNDIGEGKRAKYYLSKNWYDSPRNQKMKDQIMKNAYNYLHNIRKARSGGKNGNTLYTTYIEVNKHSPLASYKQSFLQCNQKASNSYTDRYNLAYLINIFEDPEVIKFFSVYDISYDQDGYALSTMIQWIWRSAIRIDEKIYIYIPSKRMRNLLIKWLGVEQATN